MREIEFKAVTGFENGNPQEELIKFPYENFDGLVKGKPITKKLAKNLVKENMWPDLPPNQNAAIVFDARPLLLLLSQKNCKGIRFYYARKGNTANDEETLVLVGVDESGNDLNFSNSTGKTGCICMDPDNKEKSLIFEVGGGNGLTDFQ